MILPGDKRVPPREYCLVGEVGAVNSRFRHRLGDRELLGVSPLGPGKSNGKSGEAGPLPFVKYLFVGEPEMMRWFNAAGLTNLMTNTRAIDRCVKRDEMRPRCDKSRFITESRIRG